MPEKKHDAAIDADELMSESLGKLSAADFLTALQTKNLLRYVSVWPEKKKVELWLEPEKVGEIDLGRFIDVIKGEKKKVEYEVPPWFDRIEPNPQPSLRRLEDLVQTLDMRLSAIESRFR